MYFNWADTQLLLLVEHSMQRREYNESLRLLAKAPDFGLFPHVPEAKILPLVGRVHLYLMIDASINALLKGSRLGYLRSSAYYSATDMSSPVCIWTYARGDGLSSRERQSPQRTE